MNKFVGFPAVQNVGCCVVCFIYRWHKLNGTLLFVHTKSHALGYKINRIQHMPATFYANDIEFYAVA